jgi:hypothetical protein
LLFRLFRTMMGKLAAATNAAATEATNTLASLNVDAFERIILGTSKIEGAWPPETLIRISGVLQERIVRKHIRGDEQLHSHVLSTEPICGIDPGGYSPETSAEARRLQKMEVYEEDHEINSVFLPLDFGDIFEDLNQKKYILLAQPCDLVVRANGWRRAQTRDRRQIVPLVAIDEMLLAPVVAVSSAQPRNQTGPMAKSAQQLTSSKEPGKSPTPQSPASDNAPTEYGKHRLRWLAKDESAVCVVNLNQTFHVPLWTLDLSVLNPDGSCSISKSQTAQPLLASPWAKRFGHLKVLANQVVSLAESFGKSRSTTSTEDVSPPGIQDELLSALLRLPLDTPFSVSLTSVPSESDGWTLSLGLRRVARLRERYATELLSHYASFAARFAHPHDLTTIS